MPLSRLALLILCIAVGAAVGVVGTVLSGSPWWYVAIPAAIGVGWLFVANLERCVPPRE